MRRAFVALVLALVGCRPHTPGPEDDCPAAADNLARKLGCTWAGTAAEAEAVCRTAFDGGMRYPAKCLKLAGSCTLAAACR